MNRNLAATVTFFATIAAVTLSGCGKAATDEQAKLEGLAAPASQDRRQAAVDVSAAEATVSHFLDAVRRGGDTGGAHSMLTKQACRVLEGLGRTVQPIGSPDAAFTVTRSEAVEEHPNMALVHSTWSEPTPDGVESYQVVWALQFEENAWRISGLAMELDPEQPPMIVDFEDHAQMANLFRSEPPADSDEGERVSQAPESADQAPAAR